jgi:hypothetical protein
MFGAASLAFILGQVTYRFFGDVSSPLVFIFVAAQIIFIAVDKPNPAKEE